MSDNYIESIKKLILHAEEGGGFYLRARCPGRKGGGVMSKDNPEKPSHADHVKAYMDASRSLAYKKIEADLNEEVKLHEMYRLAECYREIEREEKDV